MALNDLIAQGAQFKQPDLLSQFTNIQQLQQGQQTNALNQLKMQEMERGVQENNQLRALYRGGMDMSSPASIAKVAAISPAQAQALGTWQTKMLQDKATAQKSGADAVGTALKNSRMQLDGVTTPEQYLQWHMGNHSDPVLGSWLTQRGSTPEQSMARIQQALAQPGGFEKLLNESKLGAEKALENHFTQFDTGTQIGTNVMPKYGTPTSSVVPGSTMTKQMSPGTAESNRIAQGNLEVNQGKLKVMQDEAALKASGGKPLTQLQQQKQRKDMAADTTMVASAKSTADELEKVADELVGNPEKKLQPHPGLGGITNWSSLVPNLPDSDAAKAQQKLDTFKGKVAALGRQMQSQNGKLGNMAVQEWKIVADAIQNINPRAGNLDEQMRDVVRQAREFANRQKEAHDLTYENVQTPTAASGGKPAARTTSSQDKEALDWANKNPNDPRAAAIKQLHGG